MKFEYNKCLKCGVQICSGSGQPLNNHKQDTYLLDDGGKVCIAFCKDCTLEDEKEMKEASKALSNFIDSTIIKKEKSENIKDIILKYQNGLCALCGEKPTGNMIVTTKGIACEMCKKAKEVRNVTDKNSRHGHLAKEQELKKRGKHDSKRVDAKITQ